MMVCFPKVTKAPANSYLNSVFKLEIETTHALIKFHGVASVD